MATTSATGGYLLPTSPPPPQGQALDLIIQQLVAGVTGLPATMVRPRAQPNDPVTGAPLTPVPNAGIDWCAVGIAVSTPDDTPSQTHHSDGDGFTILRSVYRLDVVASFYGPTSDGFARMARDGLYISQNREAMQSQGLNLVGCDPVRNKPEIVNVGLRRSSELAFRLTQTIERRYEILNVLQAKGTIRADASGKMELTPFLSLPPPVILPVSPLFMPTPTPIVTPTVTPPASFVPPSPTTVADFTTSSWSPVFTQNTDWSPFDTSQISSAGYALPQAPGAEFGPVVVDSLKTSLISNGFTAVVNFVLPSNALTSLVEMDVFHYNGNSNYSPDYSMQAIWPHGNGGPAGPGQLTVSGDNYVDYIPTNPGSAQRLAFTYTPTSVSASSNGGTVTSDTIATTGATDIGFLFENATIARVTFYPPVADADLPAMSALAV